MPENDEILTAAPEGPDGDDAAVAARVGRHLSAELDGQLGRSAAAFRLYVLAERNAGGARGRPPQPPRPVWRGGPWTFAVVGGAVAASIALLVSTAAPFMRTPADSRGVVPTPQQVVTPNAGPPVVRTDRTTRTHLYDAGTVYDAHGRPMRRYRLLNLHETRWRNDATGERVEQYVPSEDEVLYELKTY